LNASRIHKRTAKRIRIVGGQDAHRTAAGTDGVTLFYLQIQFELIETANLPLPTFWNDEFFA
jgi:hypothetical protein